MMSCDGFLERVSDLIENRLEGADLAAADRHAAGCSRCRTVRDGVAALTRELPALRADVPWGLAAAIVRAVPVPRRVSLTPRADDISWMALRRAAGWAVVFLSAGWLAFAPAVEAFASGPGAPLVAQVRDLTPDLGLAEGVRDVTGGIGSAGARLSRVVFGVSPAADEALSSATAAVPEDPAPSPP